MGGQLADLRLLDRLEIDENELPVERVANAAEYHVRGVLRMAVDEDLGGEQFTPALLDLDVDVGGAAGVRDWLEGAEVVLALPASSAAAEPLEVRVPLPAAAVGAVEVDPAVVHLPDLDHR